MKCLSCKKEFKSITNTHLLKCCGLTIKEYSIKYNIPLEYLISDKQKEVKDKQKNTPRDPNILKRISDNARNRQIVKKLTYDEKQVIIGSLLGDGYIHIGNKSNSSTYLILEQGIKQLNYLFWKGMRLKRLNAKFYQYYKYNNVKKRVTTRNQVRTSSFYIIGDMIPYFYKEDGKYINPEVLNHLEAPGIAIWFMDDATAYKHGGSIATQSFSLSDNQLLCDFFINKFKITPHILKNNDQPILAFDTKEFKKLCDLVEPYMFHEMMYKINKPVNQNCSVAKRVIFDSSHFLDEYDGKCSNLHGGRYELWVYVKGAINPDTGMVLDYGYMKTILDKYIVNEFDHHCLNYTSSSLGWRSTTELLCMYIWKVLIEFFPGLSKLELNETEGSKCEYIGPSFEDMKKDKSLEILNVFKEKSLTWRQRIITELPTMFSNIDTVDNLKAYEVCELKDGINITSDKEFNDLFVKNQKPENSLEAYKNFIKKMNKI